MRLTVSNRSTSLLERIILRFCHNHIRVLSICQMYGVKWHDVQDEGVNTGRDWVCSLRPSSILSRAAHRLEALYSLLGSEQNPTFSANERVLRI